MTIALFGKGSQRKEVAHVAGKFFEIEAEPRSRVPGRRRLRPPDPAENKVTQDLLAQVLGSHPIP